MFRKRSLGFVQKDRHESLRTLMAIDFTRTYAASLALSCLCVPPL